MIMANINSTTITGPPLSKKSKIDVKGKAR